VIKVINEGKNEEAGSHRLFAVTRSGSLRQRRLFIRGANSTSIVPPFPPGPFTFTFTLASFINSDLGGPDNLQIGYQFGGIGKTEFYFAPEASDVPGSTLHCLLAPIRAPSLPRQHQNLLMRPY
jgi:hypothetical protein